MTFYRDTEQSSFADNVVGQETQEISQGGDTSASAGSAEKGAPPEETAAIVAAKYLPGVRSAHRVPEGVSTYVYRVETEDGDCFLRFLPEDATFGVEVLAQQKLADLGVPVPRVLHYEPWEPLTGRSMMLTARLPGKPLSPAAPEEILRPVLRQAGQALKRLHSVPVAGFGWVDRRFETELRGEKADYLTYFDEFLESDLSALAKFFSKDSMARLCDLTQEARQTLNIQNAVLVHGDFCMEHIFHENGVFTGFIDFGEIRGNHPYFDLGAFWNADETAGQQAAQRLFEGYGDVDLRAVYLSALCFTLRFAGKKAELPAGAFWRNRLAAAMARLDE